MTEPSTDETSSGHILPNLLLFGRVLRELGLDVHSGRMLDVVEVLGDVGFRRRQDFSLALRTLLVHRQQDLQLFDEAFRVFWRAPKDRKSRLDLRSIGEQRRFRQPLVAPPKSDGEMEGNSDVNGDVEEPGDLLTLTRTYSAREVLRTKDFAEYTASEVAEARRIMEGVSWDLGTRRTRRWQHGNGPEQDMRRVVRHNLKYGGEILKLPERRRKVKERPLVLICDISGSMERYTRMLLHFVHSLKGGMRNVEAFVFATRLTHITNQLAYRGVDDAVREVSKSVPDWAGGTRIGEALKAFNYRWARRVLGWGSVAIVISDGWDRGDPVLLGNETARLQRSCHRLVWLNPLLGPPEYEPLTRGLQAVLPYVDDHMPVGNLASLEDLAEHLSNLGTRRGARPQQRPATPGVADEEPQEKAGNGTAAAMLADSDSPLAFRHPLWGRRSRG